MVQTAQKPQTRTADPTEVLPIVLRFSPLIELTEEQFAEFCSLNRDLRIERASNGELEVMSPTNWDWLHADHPTSNMESDRRFGHRLRFFYWIHPAQWRGPLP